MRNLLVYDDVKMKQGSRTRGITSMSLYELISSNSHLIELGKYFPKTSSRRETRKKDKNLMLHARWNKKVELKHMGGCLRMLHICPTSIK